MKCIVPCQNVKIISRAVHSLARVGDELFVEPTQDYLQFRTVNTAQSAFAEFKMCRSFFSSYLFSNEDSEAKCKVMMKSCFSVFKNLHNPDKQVESCEIRYKPDGTVLVFQIKFMNLSVKKYLLPVIDTEAIEASFKPDESNVLVAPSKFLSSCLKNFRHSEDEVTITVSKEKTVINNHLELSRDINLMRTELSFGPSEFTSYTVTNPTRITFCLKEFRAVLMFAEPSNLPVTLCFSSPGIPIIFQVLNHPAYEANYVVSTLNSSDMSRNMSQIVKELNRSQSQDSRLGGALVGPGNCKQSVPKDPFSFQSNDPNVAPLSFLRDTERPGTSRKSFGNSFVEDANDNQFAADNANITVDNEEDATSEASNDNELPSHLVQTVFARCFTNYNCLDSLPGHDVVLSQNSEFK